MSRETPLTLEENPFAPGPGRMPPVLAGREAEQTQLRTCLLRLQNGKEISPTLLSAPRGMGKTVLLRWLQQQARAAKVEMLEISANEVRTLLDLAGLLAPKLLEAVSVSDKGKANIGIAGIERSRAVTMPPPALAARLKQELIKQRRNKPLIISIDEAHTLNPEVAQDLVNLDQNLVKENCAIWTILAGTPGLTSRLASAAVAAAFIERSDPMSPSLLTGAAPREALVAPLEERGWSVNETASRTVLTDAQGYPFFLQLWGRALWEAGVSLKARRLDEAVVAMAGEAVNKRQTIFFKDRCRELESRLSPSLDADRVLGAAAAVAQTWLDGGKTPLTTGQLRQCMNDCGVDSDSRKTLETLFEHSGFLVDLGNNKWGPGIPSLANYVCELTAAAIPSRNRNEGAVPR